MNTLQTLTIQADRISQIILENGGELTPDLERELSAIETGVAQKIDSYDFVIDSLEKRAEFFKDQATRRLVVARGMEKAASYLKDNIKAHMIRLGTTDAVGEEVRFKLSQSKPKLVIDEIALPADFKMIVSELVPDKEKILATLGLGESVPGAQLVPTHSLRRYINKGEN